MSNRACRLVEIGRFPAGHATAWKDIPTYDNIAVTLNYSLFQGLLVVNNGQFGGSNFHAPLKESYERKIIHFHGQAQAAIGFAEISPEKFVTRPAEGSKTLSPVGDWKPRPAGWTGPQA
ncbi:MAG: hypothetical protein NTW21_38910 [Verrucomicrobia bacterium]|nr:hypothetical protein [Verrucomicrobiota bacterium]